VFFTPVEQGFSSRWMLVDLTTSGRDHEQLRLLAQGTGILMPRIMELSGDLAFGDVTVGESATKTFTIRNTGKDSMAWSSLDTGQGPVDRTVGVFTAKPSASVGANLYGQVPAGGSVSVMLTFTPAAATNYDTTLTVTSNKTSGTNTLPITGMGIQPTRIMELSGDLAFGDVMVGESATKTFTIRNIWKDSLSWNGLDTGNGGYTTEGCESVATCVYGGLAAGGSETVTVRFTPRNATSYNSTLTVISDLSSGTKTIELTGTGIAAPETRIIGLSGDLAFGDVTVGTNIEKTLTISNSGNSTLTWSGLSTGNGVFTASATSGTVAAGGSTLVTLDFFPTRSWRYSSTLTVTSDATSGTNTSTLSGTGTALPLAPPTAALSLSGTTAFGNVTVGESATIELTISSIGGATLEWPAPREDSDGVFSTQPPWGSLSAEYGSQIVIVTFTPTDAVPYSRLQRITGNHTFGNDTYTLTGTGIAPATRIIELSGDLAFGNVAVTTSVNRTLTISNTGNSPLTWTSLNTGNVVFTANRTSGVVAAGTHMSVTLTFTPTEEIAYPGTLTVTSNNTDGTETIAVSGSGCKAGEGGCVSGF
jgi:hypothetical protein